VAGGNHDDSTMLMFDVAGGHEVMDKLLLDHGADVAGCGQTGAGPWCRCGIRKTQW
jgi:hypothetical protein